MRRFATTASGLVSTSAKEAAPQIIYPPEGAHVDGKLVSAKGWPGLAAFMLSQSTDRQRARVLWEQIYRGSEHEYMQKNAEHRLRLSGAQVGEVVLAVAAALGPLSAPPGWVHPGPPRTSAHDVSPRNRKG